MKTLVWHFSAYLCDRLSHLLKVVIESPPQLSDNDFGTDSGHMEEKPEKITVYNIDNLCMCNENVYFPFCLKKYMLIF